MTILPNVLSSSDSVLNVSSQAHGYWGLFGKSVKVFCAELGDPASCMDEEEPVDEDPDHGEPSKPRSFLALCT